MRLTLSTRGRNSPLVEAAKRRFWTVGSWTPPAPRALSPSAMNRSRDHSGKYFPERGKIDQKWTLGGLEINRRQPSQGPFLIDFAVFPENTSRKDLYRQFPNGQGQRVLLFLLFLAFFTSMLNSRNVTLITFCARISIFLQIFAKYVDITPVSAVSRRFEWYTTLWIAYILNSSGHLRIVWSIFRLVNCVWFVLYWLSSYLHGFLWEENRYHRGYKTQTDSNCQKATNKRVFRGFWDPRENLSDGIW